MGTVTDRMTRASSKDNSLGKSTRVDQMLQGIWHLFSDSRMGDYRHDRVSHRLTDRGGHLVLSRVVVILVGSIVTLPGSVLQPGKDRNRDRDSMYSRGRGCQCLYQLHRFHRFRDRHIRLYQRRRSLRDRHRSSYIMAGCTTPCHRICKHLRLLRVFVSSSLRDCSCRVETVIHSSDST
ncbi:uncharacterized protein LOC132298726 [Cornus florida]|uniref:uncharacterized protein LOC132298726 n=1 Tax=Cornus florida TaxID=4283 RepID=UPI00289D5E03|nr:uncharacterized protein LOC132298726 [Cornus florida]